MAARKPKKNDSPDFERAMAELEETVRRLEGGDLPLEQALAAFEKGVALARTLHSRIDAVQTRIDELTQGEGGEAVLSPLAAGETGDEEDDEDEDLTEDPATDLD
ncbi:MAG: exodeoxyribonuclease VII small subunit [Candidatus Binatia bacterium]